MRYRRNGVRGYRYNRCAASRIGPVARITSGNLGVVCARRNTWPSKSLRIWRSETLKWPRYQHKKGTLREIVQRSLTLQPACNDIAPCSLALWSGPLVTASVACPGVFRTTVMHPRYVVRQPHCKVLSVLLELVYAPRRLLSSGCLSSERERFAINASPRDLV